MGEYAQAAIWAEMNGMEFSDMSGEDFANFYDEYDREALAPDFKAKTRCPLCNKRLKSRLGVRSHLKDFHKNAKGAAALAALQEEER
jgi:hypothetical protein